MLAVSARKRSDEKDCINGINICPARTMKLAESALLINSIDNLLQKCPHESADETDQDQTNYPTDGPSNFLDDFCNTDANRNIPTSILTFLVEEDGVQEKKEKKSYCSSSKTNARQITI